MQEKGPDTAADSRGGDSGRLERIEALLTRQQEHNNKMLRSSHIHTVIMIVFAVVFAIGLIALSATLSAATQELPAMMRSVTELTDTAAREIGKLGTLDFGALNETIKGIASIRFDVLSQSIEELRKIIAPLAGFMGNFS